MPGPSDVAERAHYPGRSGGRARGEIFKLSLTSLSPGPARLSRSLFKFESGPDAAAAQAAGPGGRGRRRRRQRPGQLTEPLGSSQY